MLATGLLVGFWVFSWASEAEADPPTNRITAVNVSTQDARTIVTVKGSRRPDFNVYLLAAPPRLVVDVAASQFQGVPARLAAQSPLVEEVNLSQRLGRGGRQGRLVLALRREVAYRTALQGNDLVITLTGAPPRTSAAAQAAAEVERVREARQREETLLQRVRQETSAAVAERERQQRALARGRRQGRQEAPSEAAAQVAAAEKAASAAERTLRQVQRAREQAEARAQQAETLAHERGQALEEAQRGAHELARQAAARQRRADQLTQDQEAAEERARQAQQSERRAASRALALARQAAAVARRQAERAHVSHEQANRQIDRQREELAQIQQQLTTARAALADVGQQAQTAAAAHREALARAEQAEGELAAEQALRQRAEERARTAEQERRRSDQELAQARQAQARAQRQAASQSRTVTQARRQVAELTERARGAEQRANQADSARQQAEAEVRQAAQRASAALAAQQAAEQRLRQSDNQTRAAAQREVVRLRNAAVTARRAARRAEAAQQEALALAQRRAAQAERAAELMAAAEQRLALQRQAAQTADAARQQAEQRADEAEQTRDQALQRLRNVAAQVETAQREAAEARASQERAENEARQAQEVARRATARADEESRLAEAAAGPAAGDEESSEGQTDVQAASAPEVGSMEARRLQRLAQMRGDEAARQQGLTPGSAPEGGVTIRDVRYASHEGRHQVVIDVSGRVQYTLAQTPQGQATLELHGVTVPDLMARTLDVSEIEGPVAAVSTYAAEGRPDAVIAVDLRRPARSEVRREGNRVVLELQPREGTETASSQDSSEESSPASVVVAQEQVGEYQYGEEEAAGFVSAVPLEQRRVRRRQNYRGRRIDLDFVDADIHNILRLLSDVGRVNIIAADDVRGTVSIKMRNVPWDQALDVILRSKGLGMVQEGNMIRVAPVTLLEKEREMELARRKHAIQLAPLETRIIPVSYAMANELMPRAQELLSGRGSISMDERTNVLIARDLSGNLDQIEELLRALDTQTPQVLIEARIVEATMSQTRQIGIQWGGDIVASAATGNPTGIVFPNSIGLAGGATDGQTPTAGLAINEGATTNPNFAVNLPAPVGTGSGGALGLTLGSVSNNAHLSIRLSALEDTGTLRIISSPRILTMDNSEAHIEQGTMIPYSQVSAQGVQTAFQEAKLNLTVTPHVTADGSVLLQVSITRDEPDFNNRGARGDPTILKREAETQFIVHDGHTVVIGGIYTRNSGINYAQVPGLARIPILGWLFKSRRESDRRSEMLIFITPRIVNRAESIGR
jgi:type IV pilus assembly protein PilQ